MKNYSLLFILVVFSLAARSQAIAKWKIEDVVKKYEKQKVKLLLVSLDLPSYYPAKIAAFAKKNKYTAKIVWLNETNADHFCPMIDKSWSGAIPATFVVNNKKGYRKFMEAEMSKADFETIIQEAITQDPSTSK